MTWFKPLILPTALFLVCTCALADTLVLYDGRRIPGEVTQTAEGYSVKTRFGTTIQVESTEVKEWIKGNGTGPVSSPKPFRTPQATPHPATAPVATRPAGTRPGDALVQQGSDALLAKEYKIAREIFTDAVSVEPRNVRALQGMALTLMYLNDFKGAQSYMERALAFAGPKPDRALILNNAMLQIALNNPMRAVKFTREYIESHFNTPDEPMLNALGSALFLADDNARKNMLWGSTADLYAKYQKALEATRPGMKRWGVEWLPAAEVEKKLSEMRKKEVVADRIGQQVDLAEDRVIRAKRQLREARNAQLRGNATALEVNIAQVNLTEKLTEFHTLAKAYDEACDTIVRPTWPRVLTPVALDDVNPPGAEAANLAMNDPVYKEAMANAGKSTAPKRALSEPDDQPKPATAPATVTPPPAVVAIKTEKPTKVRVTRYAAAFAIAPDLVITAAAPLENAVDFELQTTDGASFKAEVIKSDPKTGLALLKPAKKLPFMAIAENYTSGPIACAAFPSVNLFNPAAEMLTGISNPAKGDVWSIKLMRHPRLMASPVLSNRRVVGVVMATRENALDSLPAVSLDALKAFVADAIKAAPAGAPASEPTAAMLQLIAIREASAGSE